MSFGFMPGFKPSEEERRKKKEEFERKRAELGLGINNKPAGFIGAGKLAQQAPQAVPRQSPTQIAAQEREQAFNQQRQAQASQSANRAAELQETRGNIQDVLKLPAKDQPRAVAGLGRNTSATTRANAASPLSAQEREQTLAQPKAPTQPYKSNSSITDGLLTANQTLARTAPIAFGGVNFLTLGRFGTAADNLSNDLEKMKSTYEAPREEMTPAGRNQVRKQMTGMGINLDFPLEKRANTELNPIVNKGLRVAQPQADAEPIAKSYVDDTPAKIGFNPASNPSQIAQFAQLANQGSGFRMPNAPTRSWSERQERESLLRDASTSYKGSQNGQLTAKQMELRAGIVGADDKYKNNQYNAQLGAASQMAQAQMSQTGANARAALTEMGSNNRFDSQLGFDAAKFQETAKQQQQQLQQKTGNESRRLDIAQDDMDVKNYTPKQIMQLFEQRKLAKTPEEISEIDAQIQSLSGGSKPQSPVLVNNTGQTATGDSTAPFKDNAAMLYLPDSREWVQPPTAQRSFGDPTMVALQARDDIDIKEKERLANLYMDGGDI